MHMFNLEKQKSIKEKCTLPQWWSQHSITSDCMLRSAVSHVDIDSVAAQIQPPLSIYLVD